MATHISFRTDEATCDELDKIAANMDRDRSWVINEAIAQYLDLKRWQIEHIRAGIADTDAGRTLSHEQVKAKLAKHRKQYAARRTANAK